MADLSARSHHCLSHASAWEEIWEAGPYFERLSELLEDAQHYALIAGWQIDSRLPMPRPMRPAAPNSPYSAASPGMRETLLQKVLRICDEKPDFHFYFLMWDHSYLYVPERELWQGRIWDTVHPRVHFIFDNRHPFGGAHHEKICVLDGQVALCGGIDICGDRWDGPEHLYRDPRRSLDWKHEHHGPYHDLAVQVSGPVCAELQAHLGDRWRALSSIPFPELPTSPLKIEAGHAVHVSRTQANGKSIVREIEFLFRDLVHTAERRIVLEGQYFWSHRITDLLVDKMLAMRGRPFEIIVVLADLAKARSYTRKMAVYEMSLLNRLREAARITGTRLILGAPYVHASPSDGPDSPPRSVYIHSKLLIIDDRYLSVGSANFAARAFRIDTEVNLTLEARTPSERSHIERVYQRVRHHWGLDCADSASECGLRLHALGPRTATRWQHLSQKFYPLFFDPVVPWGYFAKRKLLATSRRHPARSASALAALLIASSVFTLWLAQASPGWAWIYAWLLSASWLLAIPFFPTMVLASVHLGGDLGSRLAIGGFWIASISGYIAGRIYPTISMHRLRRIPTHGLQERLGRRSFDALIRVVLDPTIELRAKIAFQGIYCIPLPWFGLASGVILPAACSMICRASARVTELLMPTAWLTFLRAHPASFAIALMIWICARNLLRLKTETAHAPANGRLRRSRRSPSTVKDHKHAA